MRRHWTRLAIAGSLSKTIKMEEIGGKNNSLKLSQSLHISWKIVTWHQHNFSIDEMPFQKMSS
jgi:hypothetical protein